MAYERVFWGNPRGNPSIYLDDLAALRQVFALLHREHPLPQRAQLRHARVECGDLTEVAQSLRLLVEPLVALAAPQQRA